MADGRLYVVKTKNGTTPKTRLFKAGTRNQLESHLTAETWDIEAASPMDVAELMSTGVTIEETKKDA